MEDLNKFLEKYASYEEILVHHQATLLFFKNDSCAPCKTLKEHVKQLINNKYHNITFIVADAKKNPQIAASVDVFSTPTIILYFEGKEYLRKGNFTSIIELDEKIGHYYQLYFENKS